MFVVVMVSLFKLILEEQRDTDTHMYLGTIGHKFWVSMSTFWHLLGGYARLLKRQGLVLRPTPVAACLDL